MKSIVGKMFRKKFTPKKEIEKPKLKDIARGSEGVKINFTKLQDAIKKCEEDKNNTQCRRELNDLGIEIIDY